MHQKTEGRPPMGRPPRTRLHGPGSASNIRYSQGITASGETQLRMGTALRAYLKRFEQDLQAYAADHPDRIVEQMIGCIQFLLIEADRLEGGVR